MATKTYSIYLAKEEVIEFEDVFKSDIKKRIETGDRVTSHTSESLGDFSKLFIFNNKPKPPGWLVDVQSVFKTAHEFTNELSHGAVVFQQSGRIFIVAFGHGWQYIDDENVEKDFGLKVAVNLLDDTKLNRIDKANIREAMKDISHSPAQRNLQAFGVDDALSLISRVTGKSENNEFANSISGSTSLRFSKDMTLSDLPLVATEALILYQSDFYKNTAFKIIDKIKPVRDKSLQRKLNQMAVDKIIAGEDNFELSMPGWSDEDVVYYQFVGLGKSNKFPDLLLSDYKDFLGAKLHNLDVKAISSNHKIEAELNNNTTVPKKWSIKKALIGSIVLDDVPYAINEGEWYEINEAFKKSIDYIVDTVVQEWEAGMPLPINKELLKNTNKVGLESELSYNKRCAKVYNQICMDQEIFNVETYLLERGMFEACDILDIENKKLIHVKKSSRRSSLLSHLFKQGGISAQILNAYPDVRKMLIDKVEKISGKGKSDDLKKALGDSMVGWTVEFHIVDAPRKDGVFKIPFFSRITLRDEKMRLEGLGFKVALKFIPKPSNME